MTLDFWGLDYQKTPQGELSLRRRAMPGLDGKILYEVKLSDEFLMSSLLTRAEIQLARLGLTALEGWILAKPRRRHWKTRRSARSWW